MFPDLLKQITNQAIESGVSVPEIIFHLEMASHDLKSALLKSMEPPVPAPKNTIILPGQ